MIGWLTEAGMFRAVQPRQWGGLELTRRRFRGGGTRRLGLWLDRLGRQCRRHPPLAHRDVRSAGTERRLVRQAERDGLDLYAPTGQARRVSGGFRLSGRWSFSSGVDHCGWVILGAVVPDDAPEGLGPEFRSFLVPRGDFTVDQDSWHVTGLAGTGSEDVLVADAFVPSIARILNPRLRADRPRPRGQRSAAYQLPWSVVFPYAIASPAIGAAAGALELFVENNRERVWCRRRTSASPGLHLRLAGR